MGYNCKRDWLQMAMKRKLVLVCQLLILLVDVVRNDSSTSHNVIRYLPSLGRQMVHSYMAQ